MNIKQAIQELWRISRWTKNFRVTGADFRNTPEGATITIPSGGNSPSKTTFVPGCLIKVTGNATGGGVYNGRTVSEPASGLNPAVALAEGNMGTVFGSDNCYVINGAEVGQATHDLTFGTPVAKLFVAILQRTPATDGKPVYAISGYDWKVCA